MTVGRCLWSLAIVGALTSCGPEEVATPATEQTAPTASNTPSTSPVTSATTSTAPPTTTPPVVTSTSAVTTSTVASSTTTASFDSTEIQRVLGELVIAEPDRAVGPYERETYDGSGWPDDDGDCRNMRHELLELQSLVPVEHDESGCFVEAGRWIDPYTGVEYTEAEEVSIDHVVPLAEAHRAGAWRWSGDTRERFASDDHPGHLRVIGASVGQDKADQRPDQWLPTNADWHCQYAIDWITTKARYALTIVETERDALLIALESCATRADDEVEFHEVDVASVVTTSSTTSTTTSLVVDESPGTVELISCDNRAEVVTIGNPGATAASLDGWILHDDGVNHSVELGRFGTLDSGQQLDILTGPDAVQGTGAVVWKRQNVWNNDGDEATLIGPDGPRSSLRCG